MPRVQVDWKELREIPPGSHGTPRGYCEGCGLYVWSEGGLKVPGVRGLFCSVLCFECELFGAGRCRWCGEKLKGVGKFCGDACRKKSEPVKFGDGTRLLNFLSRRHPSLYQRLIGQNAGVCLNCSGPLAEKNEGAKFCSPGCKQRFWRKSGNSRKSGKNRNTNLVESSSYEGPKNGTVLPPREPGFGDIRNGT